MSQVTLVRTARVSVLWGAGGFAAALLEPVFIRQLTFVSAFEVGFIEEFAMMIGMIVVARHRRHDSEIDGIILGGTAGMGFAGAREYWLMCSPPREVESGGTLGTLVLASVMFREGLADRFRLDRAVIGAYLTVVVLPGCGTVCR